MIVELQDQESQRALCHAGGFDDIKQPVLRGVDFALVHHLQQEIVAAPEFISQGNEHFL